MIDEALPNVFSRLSRWSRITSAPASPKNSISLVFSACPTALIKDDHEIVMDLANSVLKYCETERFFPETIWPQTCHVNRWKNQTRNSGTLSRLCSCRSCTFRALCKAPSSRGNWWNRLYLIRRFGSHGTRDSCPCSTLSSLFFTGTSCLGQISVRMPSGYVQTNNNGSAYLNR